MLQIKKNNLKWAYPLTPYDLKRIDGLALHHVDHPTWGIDEIHEYHKNTKGWAGFGYGWLVMKNGEVIEGRGFNYQAHTLNHNNHLLSIVFQGDYDGVDKVMPDVQFNAGVETIKYVKSKVPTIKIIDGHKRWRPTACPGSNFPLKEMLVLNLRNQEPEYVKILKSKVNSPDEWVKFVEANKNHPVGKWLPDLIVKLSK